MKRVAMTVAMCWLWACSDSTPPPVPLTSPELPTTTVIRCGSLIDGLEDHALSNQDVVLVGDRIQAVRPTPRANSDHVVAQPGDDNTTIQTIDLGDYTCLPGLINTHVHFDANPEDSVDYRVYITRTPADHLALVLENARTTLATGFTTVRHTGAWFPSTLYEARRLIEAGEALGPRLQTAGPYLTIPGGGGDLRFPGIRVDQLPPDSQRGIASSPEAFAARTEAAIDAGADFIKVIASGAVFSLGIDPGAPEMTREDLTAVVRVAHARDVKVTAHVHSDQSGQDAIAAGVDSLEHASLLEDDTIALAAQQGVAFSMDVYNGTYTDTVGREQGYPAEFLQRNSDTTDAQRLVFEKAYRAGVPILYGTDAGVLPHDMGGWQFAIMVERGMSPMDAIKSATSVAAKHMGLEADVGAIEMGRYGDLVAVKGDPLAAIHRLQTVSVVIKGGVLVKNEH